MSIKDFVTKIKGWEWKKSLELQGISDDLFLVVIILLVALGSFGLGRLSRIESARSPVTIENIPQDLSLAPTTTVPQTGEVGGREASAVEAFSALSRETGQVVASKTGTKYHYPWCSGAQRIAEHNKIYFASKAEAEAKGYSPAANCKGL